MTKYNLIGDILIQVALVDSTALDRALAVQSKKNVSLGKALADLGLADERAVTSAIAKGLHLESLDSRLPTLAPELDALLSTQFCQKHLVVPLSLTGNLLRLGMANPLDYSTLQDVTFRTGKQVIAVVASETSILTLLGRSQSDSVESQKTYELLINVTPEGEVVPVDENAEIVDAARL